ncbi:MAG TPA: phosphate ABC transporter permease PstA [Streptosporangiaceae bacterium]|jgi:phosphate transport system permease protein|nr:phosphate ABC transporter permease PstA [Streptosporangiaceae bacterium]
MTAVTDREATGAPPRLVGPRRPLEPAFRLTLLVSLVIAVLFLVILLVYVVTEGWPRLDARLWENFPSRLFPERAGAQSAIFGTVYVIALTAVFCIPIGVMTAIYLEEYADRERWYNRIIELNIQNLAAVPSIVYGILGLGIIARGIGLGITLITAALTLSLLVLPVVIIAAREAIRAVPNSIRQGSLALGATQWQTIWRQVLPAAVPGMATGAILALSRAIGEAAPLLLLGAVTHITFNPASLTDSYTVLPIQIFNWIKEPEAEFHTLAAAAIVILLTILLAMNSVAIWLRNRYQKRW